MAEPKKMSPQKLAAERRKITAGLTSGELTFEDAVRMAEDEARRQDDRDMRESAQRRFGDPNKSKKKRVPTPQEPPVPEIARAMTVSRVLLAMDGVDQDVHDLILGEFSELKPEMTLSEIGSAEAMMLDAAVRLVLRRPKPEPVEPK